MAQGVAILKEEFPGTDINMGMIQLMFEGDSTSSPILSELKSTPFSTSVNVRLSVDSLHTLYTILMPGDANLAPITRELRETYGPDVVIESSQDGVTPPISAIIIAGALVAIVLLVMSQSWLDPLLFLLTIGIAVVINMGSNALLPYVSVTTNYIVAILQLVLALDYAIILMNRYRQELENDTPPEQAVTTALKKAYPSILSSSLTTVVGLLMLCFMRLRIGIDLGVVLAKGVLCCLICTFTVLPSLILIFHRWLQRLRKPTLVIPTDKIAILAARYKYPIAIFALVLFGTTYFYSKRTNIYFCTFGESTITRIFPKVNPVVLIYPSEEEQTVLEIADSLSDNPYINQLVSYPTLLRRQYTAPQMYSYFMTMTHDFAEYMPADLDLSMMTPEMVQLLYYIRSGAADSLCVPFADMMRFVSRDCLSNPLFSSFITAEMQAQSELLSTLIEVCETTPTPSPEVMTVMEPIKPVRSVSLVQRIEVVPVMPDIPTSRVDAEVSPIAVAPVVSALPTITADSIPFIPFLHDFYQAYPTAENAALVAFADTTKIYQPMDINEMSAYMTSTPSQTSFIYRTAKATLMTPHDYVHFLVDDLFHRPALAGMVTKAQKQQLQTVVDLMTYAENDAAISASAISSLLARRGLNVPPARILAVVGLGETNVNAQYASHHSALIDPVLPERYMDTIITYDEVVTYHMPEQKVAEEPDQATLFATWFADTTCLSSVEMASRFSRLGYALDEPTLHLLYAYYGHSRYYDNSLTMSPEQLLHYAVDTLLVNPVIGSYLDDHSREMIAGGQASMDEAISMIRGPKHSVMAIVTSLPGESAETYEFVANIRSRCEKEFLTPCYLVGESVMYDEMKSGFSAELTRISWLTILAIFLIVALTFRSVFIPTILILVVMTAVYVDVIFSGLMSGGMLYLAYLISQSILMGATIDYGILYTNYYREFRRDHSKAGSARLAYRGSIRTIMTSGTIMTLAPGAMAVLVSDVTISSIVMCIAIGACAAILLILFVVPGLLDAFDRLVIRRK